MTSLRITPCKISNHTFTASCGFIHDKSHVSPSNTAVNNSLTDFLCLPISQQHLSAERDRSVLPVRVEFVCCWFTVPGCTEADHRAALTVSRAFNPHIAGRQAGRQAPSGFLLVHMAEMGWLRAMSVGVPWGLFPQSHLIWSQSNAAGGSWEVDIQVCPKQLNL